MFGREQKLLPPVVLDTGSIFLNAAASDDKIELSKIVPSRYGDADVKTTTSLELRRNRPEDGHLGASYPQIVAVLENGKRQRNLVGDLVVDAVPVSNRVYLEAVLGKDTTAKRDDSIKRTSGENSKSGRRWLFGIFGRDSDDSASRHFRKGVFDQADSGSSGASRTWPPLPGQRVDASSEQSDDSAKNGTDEKKSTDGSSVPTAKKDEAVQKATADDSPPSRRRLFDFFRRDDE